MNFDIGHNLKEISDVAYNTDNNMFLLDFPAPCSSWAQFGVADPRNTCERVHEIAFTSSRKRMDVSENSWS